VVVPGSRRVALSSALTVWPGIGHADLSTVSVGGPSGGSGVVSHRLRRGIGSSAGN
jgi:hypothetical protein